MLGNVSQNGADIENLRARVDTIQLAVGRLADQAEQIQSRLDQSVTKDELARSLDRAMVRLEKGVDARFERQARSVEALRRMVGQTDELLQKVLDGLESLKDESRPRPDREWEFAQTRS